MTRDEYLSQLRDRASKQSFLASEVARKLGYVAGAGGWLFKNENFQFPYLILIALAFLCGYFILDILQYLVGWKLSSKLFYLVSSKNPLPPEAEQIITNKHRIILDNIFFSKLMFLLVCYCFMIGEIICQAYLIKPIQLTSFVGG